MLGVPRADLAHGSSLLGSLGNKVVYLILPIPRYNMTTRSRPVRIQFSALVHSGADSPSLTDSAAGVRGGSIFERINVAFH